MNCLWDYVGFAIWFAGLGYLVLWPLSASGSSGDLYGAALLCQAQAASGLVSALCRAPHPLTLSPALHALGAFALLAAVLRLLCRGLGCARRARAARVVRVPAAMMPPPRPRLTQRALPRVKPRSQFGLRGMPY